MKEFFFVKKVPDIKEFGYHLFKIVLANMDKSDQNKKTIMTAMIIIAVLFVGV